MNREIIQQIVEELQELELKSIKKGLEERNVGDLNICFRDVLLEIGSKILKEIYEKTDEELFIKNKENHLYQVIKKDSKTLVTSLGEVKFTRRLYRDKKVKFKYLPTNTLLYRNKILIYIED